MAVNKYFNNFAYAREQDLVEDLVIESIKIYGHDMKYIPRTVIKRDNLFGEDTLSQFNSAADIEMYIKNIDGFEGEGDFLSKFGLEIRDQMTMTVARKRFDQIRSEKLMTEVGYNYVQEAGSTVVPFKRFLANTSFSNFNIELEEGTANNYSITSTRPQEGDLLFFPMVDKLFEIKFVEHESVFYQSGRLQTYDLRCELFEYSSEVLDTGFSEIDGIQTDNSLDILVYEITLEENLQRATGTASISSGAVTSVTITDGGSYITAPTITFTDPPQGVVSGITVTVAGAGHVNGQNYNTTGGSGSGLVTQGQGSGGMIGATIVDGGTGYQVGDVVQTATAYPASIRIDSVTNHTTAAGTAVLNSNGVVTSVTITTAGTGYTSAPTVTFTQATIEANYNLEDGGALLYEHTIETTDATANNEFFQTQVSSIIDFSERNPFSEIDRY